MSKKFKGKTCVYCATPNSSSTGDHVICRSFFPVERRANLPEVPACKGCNKDKSELEHYLATILPTGSRSHYPSTENPMTDSVIAKLEKNHKLRRELSSGIRSVFNAKLDDAGNGEYELPLNGSKLLKLFELIAQGLAYYHWGIVYPEGYNVLSYCPGRKGQEIFREIMSRPDGEVITRDIGEGIFRYRSTRLSKDDDISIWKMSLYGAEFQAASGDDVERLKDIYVVIASKLKPNLVEMLNITVR